MLAGQLTVESASCSEFIRSIPQVCKFARRLQLEIDLFAANASPKLVLFEGSQLPDSDEGRSLTAARPAEAAPAYTGDSALVFVTLDLKP
jgi:hypothetical protein